ncbi:four helix bundle protein [Thermodesulfatator atlanticus]
MKDYKELRVWNEAMDLVVDIYKIIKNFPKEENYVLADQIRRSVISIPSNIAEGANRNTKKEFIQFLYIALGSSSELETQLLIAKRLGYVFDIEKELETILKIRKMVNSLIKSLKGTKP